MTRTGGIRLGLVALLVPLALGAASFRQEARPSRLYKDARQLLAVARAQGRTEVTLLVLAEPGRNGEVARRAERLGGEVRHREDAVDYLRVRLPIGRAAAFAESPRITAVTLDYNDSEFRRLLPEARDSGSMAATPLPSSADTTWPPRWSERPLTHPYRAIRDIDGEDFQQRNPTFDGRGVTIAVIDGHLDFLLPEFRTAYTLDGTRVPKLADVINTTDPREDAHLMPQWVDMRTEVVASGGRVVVGGKTHVAPHDGRFRAGVFDERRFNDPANAAYMEQDVDRNGNPEGDDGKFGVLWDERTNEVWVDTDRDLDFTDERALTDYRVRQEHGVFGADDPKTKVRESIGFTVQTDARNRFVSINLGIYQHATKIMGHVVGNPEPEGRIRGLAPGARIVSIFYGPSSAHALFEALIAAAKHPDVDVIVNEASVAVAAMTYHLADGRHPVSILTQRLIERYGKPVFVPGGNDPGFALTDEDGQAPAAFAVGGYQHRDSYLANHGFAPAAADNLHWGALAHGPNGAGALKPDFLAPSGQVSVDIGYADRPMFQWKRGLYALPPGYGIDGGTSAAAPMAAGAAALVISAAKQTGLRHDPARLAAALEGSARHLPNLQAHEQGNGVIQVGAAFELLKQLQDAEPVVIESRAPVRTRIAHLLGTPHTGEGLYEREGWTVGERRTRTITLTRRSGPKGPMTFELAWQGNDSGTFRSASSVTLPLNRAVELPVEIAPASHGAHSAILTLGHPSIPGHAHRVLHTVVAAHRLSAENGYTAQAELVVPRPVDRAFLVEVPEGTRALRLRASSEDGAVSLNLVSPGRELTGRCAPAVAAAGTCTVADPEPGVWDVTVTMHDMIRDYDPGVARPLAPGRVRVGATAVGVDVAVATPVATTPRAGGTLDLPLALHNRLGAEPAAVVAEPLGSAFRANRRIARGEQHVYEVTVPEGATALRARVANVQGAGADLDLYLLDCTTPGKAPAATPTAANKAPPPPGPTCNPVAKAATVAAGGEAEVRDPAPGRWVVVVDAYAASAEGASYEYLDVYHHPRFGGVAVTDMERPREAGARWTVPAHVWVATAPEAGRTPWARFVAVGKGARSATGAPVPLGAVEGPLGEGAPASSRP